MHTYSPTEERWNVITHGTGTVLSVVALILLMSSAFQHGSFIYMSCALTYGLSLVILYLASTLYHGITDPALKPMLRKFDYLAIYLLIAGTNTPVLLMGIGGSWGLSLFIIIWLLALVGFIFQFSSWRDSERLSLLTYLSMGWIVVIGIKPLIMSVSATALIYLVAGGVAYTTGTFFFAKEQIKYNHAIWHVFVLAGSILHFWGIYFHILP